MRGLIADLMATMHARASHAATPRLLVCPSGRLPVCPSARARPLSARHTQALEPSLLAATLPAYGSRQGLRHGFDTASPSPGRGHRGALPGAQNCQWRSRAEWLG